MITFGLPLLFWLLPLPIIVYFLLPSAKQNHRALLVPFFNQLNKTDTVLKTPHQESLLKLITLGFIWSLVIIACARPQWVGSPINMPASGRDLLLAVDISGSMEIQDMEWQGEPINRLTSVKKVVGEFVERRESDRLGLILFGSRAYLQTPLTFDRKTVNQLLQEAELGFAGEKTAIGDAIGLSVKRLRDRPQDSRVLILLTDGANTSGEIEPLKAAELAALAKVKIYTIGIGADQMVQPGLFGTSFGSRTVNPSRDLDETTLRSIASSTGGQYFRAKSLNDLEKIYTVLDTLEPIEQEQETFRPTKSLFFWPLGSALCLSFLWFLCVLIDKLKSRYSGDTTHA